jgi:hypothetical protein
MAREKTGGRKAGTPNKTTIETRNFIQNVVNNELTFIEDLMLELTPKERVDVLIKLLPFIVPKTSEVSVIEPEKPRNILIKVNRREE